MSVTRNVVRFSLYATGMACLVVALGFAVLHFRVAKQRQRAEILFQQAKELEPGKSTLEDVRKLLQKYGNADTYTDHCDHQQCQISTNISAFQGHYHLDTELIRTLGIRPASYSVKVSVNNGIVYRAHIYVLYRANSGAWADVSSRFITEFNAADRCLNPELRQHPEYALSSQVLPNPARGGSILVGFKPKATLDQRRRAQSIDLQCITRLGNCSPADIMRPAYSDWLVDADWKNRNKEAIAAESARCESELSDADRRAPLW
jgi:hypothetical protein